MGRITRGIKKVVKPLFDISTWMDRERIRTGYQDIKDLFSSLFVLKKPTVSESFDSAVSRLSLDEQHLQKRYKEFRMLFLLHALCTLLLFSYFIWLLFNQRWIALFIVLGLTLVCAAFTFRFHFWMFQLRRRQLGCSLRDWAQSFLGK